MERKIRYLQAKYPDTEWSGVLFYTCAGSFETKDFTVTCADIYPMDLGNSTYTEFKNTPDVAAYMAEDMELFDCNIGLVHSHHSMPAFFSGTDKGTLQSEGNDTCNFVSLIVNNEGTYTAAVTRKVSVSSDVSEWCSYGFFGSDLPVSYNRKYSTEKETRIEYFMLDVEKPDIPNPFSYIDERFNEIVKNKEAKAVKASRHKHETEWNRNNSIPVPSPLSPLPSAVSPCQSSAVSEPCLFSEEEMGALPQPDPNVIHDVVAKILLCSLIVNTDKIDLDLWVKKHMVRVYDKEFGGSDMLKFVEYRDWAVGYVLDYYEDTWLSPDAMDDTTYMYAIYEAIISVLSDYQSADNKYIDSFIEAFSACL